MKFNIKNKLFCALTLSCLSFLKAQALAATPAVILASATSSSPKSSSLICLLDPKCKGSWSPGTADSGHDEGIYFQFNQPFNINYVEIVVEGSAPHDLQLRPYLDGKTTTPKLSVISSIRRQVGGNTHFIVGARSDAWENDGIDPLSTKIKSFFVKLDRFGSGKTKAPTLTRVSFYQDYVSGSENGPKLSQAVLLELPLVVDAEITASSVLMPKSAYDPSHLFDSKIDSAWATDGTVTTGVGETLQLKFKEPVTIGGLMIWNGYQRSRTHFQANGRVAEIQLASSGVSQDLRIKDHNNQNNTKESMGFQEVKLIKPIQKANEITLKIGKVYPGSKYKDVLVSELRFTDPAGKIIVPQVKSSKPEIPSPLQKWTNRSFARFLHSVGSGPSECNTSCANATFRIREDGSFVIYKDFDYGTADLHEGAVSAGVIEGNWEPKDAGLRIFGKKYTTSLRSSEYLSSKGKDSQAAIFQSEMSFTPYAKMTAEARIKTLTGILNQQKDSTFSRGSDSLNWETGLKGHSRVTATTEAKLLKQMDLLLLKRNPVFVESSVLNGLFLPTDETLSCASGC